MNVAKIEQEFPLAIISGRRHGANAVICFSRGGRQRHYVVSNRRYRALIEWSMSRKNMKLTGDWLKTSFRWYVWPLKVRPAPVATIPRQKPASTVAELACLLREYMTEFPAFRSKPEGSPYSEARMEQEADIAREDRAIAALAKAEL